MGDTTLETKMAPATTPAQTTTAPSTTNWTPAQPTGLGNGPRGGAPFAGMFDESIGNHRTKPSWQSAQPRGTSGTPLIGTSRTPKAVDLGYIDSLPAPVDMGYSDPTPPASAPRDLGYTDILNTDPIAPRDLGYTDILASDLVAPIAPLPTTANQTNGYATKPMEDLLAHHGVVDETKDASGLRGDGSRWNSVVKAENKNAPDIKKVVTHYMTDEEKAKTEVSFQNGKMLGADGKNLDTTNASGIGTQWRQGEGKHIFAMTENGTIRQADPWANKTVTNSDNGGVLGFVNHSSFVSGGAVSGAGELKVVDGNVQQVSDQSGHYRPDGKLTGQVLDELDRNNVDMDNVDVKLVGKKTVKDKNSSVPNARKMQDPIYVSANQFRQHDAENAEEEIRAEKKALKKELASTVEARRNRLDIADSEPVQEFKRLQDKDGNDTKNVIKVAPPIAPSAPSAPLPVNYSDTAVPIAPAHNFAPLPANYTDVTQPTTNATVLPPIAPVVPTPVNYAELPRTSANDTDNDEADTSVFAYAL